MQPDSRSEARLRQNQSKRRRRVAAAVCALAAALLVAMVWTTGPARNDADGSPSDTGAGSHAVTKPPWAAQSTRPEAAQGPALGVQFNGTWSNSTDSSRTKVLDQLVASGAGWVRIDVGWATIEPNRGRYDMTWAVPMVDRVLRQAHDKGLKILVTFVGAPQWASGSDNPSTPPRDPNDYARSAAWAAARWGDLVSAWEIWNEPNANAFMTGANPATYTRMLCAAYPQIHKADPRATVVFGGLMYADDPWLRRAYAAGAHGCFDALGVHPFPAPANSVPEAPDDGEVWHLSHLPAVRQVMDENGDADKPMWITEIGWSSLEPPNPKPWDTGVTQQQQADYLTRAFKYTRENYPYVTTFFWFRDADQSTGNPHEDGFGLLTTSFTPKPALHAFAKAAGKG